MTEEAPAVTTPADATPHDGTGGDVDRPMTASTAMAAEQATPAPPAEPGARPVVRRSPRRPAPTPTSRRRRIRLRRAGAVLAALVVLGVIGGGAYVALQQVYFIGTNGRGLVTMFRGVPFTLPGGVALYTSDYVSGVSGSTLTADQRRTLLDHSLRSEGNAGSLVHSLELGQLQ